MPRPEGATAPSGADPTHPGPCRSIPRETLVRTARSGPDFSRRLAAHLGDEWQTHPVGCADRAILQGPGDLELDVWISRADKRAVVETRSNASLVWADHTDYRER
ncbi:hypothetical protein [Embleya scabrispora]|uniref:hypothetical protein n=1 Tax=Embleya scabrispora TaxID=159449 RepID=UPI00117F0AFA|nr:hypothetical protein [Embleya scabrispora]